ncbi:hypothetical protein HHL11_20875 [Ramlibacter sp. G-1-2-2]|uniref:Mannose-6-phosphate isomerase n=1 Tax=Ramlibacter agri TaxID=2728837 RepID=A0A848H5Z5_9BURK|nr:AGE family epimerase/isomerase [Ramlibacter agri]NML46215.1 hypothetical protein [Ramlibacter agri]
MKAAEGFARDLRQWMHDPLLRMWSQPTARTANGLFNEALDAAWAPLAGKPQRALVAARQAFFFARMAAHGDAGLWTVAREQLELLQRLFHDPRHGGVYSRLPTERAGAPAKELYTNAFAVLAYAEGHARSGDTRWLDLADQVLDEILRGFALPDGNLATATSEDFGECLAGPAQNPQMHLFEAVLHLWTVGQREKHARILRDLALAIHSRFFDAQCGALMELPLGSEGNWQEPGHQCEWFTLVTLAGAAIAGTPLVSAIESAFAQALQVAARHGGVLPLKLSPAGEVLDGSHRIWTQLELVRAMALQEDMDEVLFATAAQALQARFLHAKGWYEVIADDGTVLRTDMPASTPYHLVTCFDEVSARMQQD